MRQIVFALFSAIGIASSAHGQQTAPAVPVGTIVAESKATTPTFEFVGRKANSARKTRRLP